MSAGQPLPTVGATSYGWRLASIRGIPIYLGRSWPVFAIFVAVTFGSRVVQPSTQEQGGTYGYAVGLGYALLLLASVLLHEGAHAVTAARTGHRVDRIVADLMGGHTVYSGEQSRPGASAIIAIAGPVTNLVIALLAYLAYQQMSYSTAYLLLGALFYSNLFVGLFNLLPGLPLDGGFVVEALVWRVTGDRNRGLIVSGWVGRVLTVLVVLGYVGLGVRGGATDPTQLIVNFAIAGLIGAFLWAGATNAIRVGTSGRAIQRVTMARVLRPIALVGAGESLAQAMQRTGPVQGALIAVDDGGRPIGIVDVAAANAVDAGHRGQVTVASVVARQPDGWVVAADPGSSDVSGVIDAIVSRAKSPQGMPQIVLVVDRSGRPLGTVSLADLDAALDA